MALTLTQLLNAIDTAITDNNNNEIDGNTLNALLKSVVNNTYPQPVEQTNSFPTYSATVNYDIGNTIFFNDLIYQAVDENGPDSTVVEPGTDTNVWQVIDPSELSHLQNTDVGLGRYIGSISPGTTVFSPDEKANNYFTISPGTGSGQISYSLNTTGYNYRFITYIPNISFGDPFTALFESDTNQECPATGLELSTGDWAVWQHIEGKTRLIASNVATTPQGEVIQLTSADIQPDIIFAGKGETSDINTERIELIPDDSGTTDTDDVVITIQAWSGTQFATDALAGYFVRLEYPIADTSEIREIISHTDTGLLTLDQEPAFTETGVSYRIQEQFFTVNELIDKYAVITYVGLTQYTNSPKEFAKITANDVDGNVLIDRSVTFFDTNADLQYVNPYITSLNDQLPVYASRPTDNIVAVLPPVSNDNDRLQYKIYREWNSDPDSDYTVFCDLSGSDTILGEGSFKLENDGEFLTLLPHFTAMPHYDEESRNGFCVCFNVNLETADTTALTNTSDEPIVGTLWSYNHPSRFLIEEVSNSPVVIYDSLIQRRLEVVCSVTVQRTAGTPVITLTAQVDSGTGWTTEKTKEITVSNQAPTENVSFPISRLWNKGDKMRFVARTDGDGYYIKSFELTTANPNA